MRKFLLFSLLIGLCPLAGTTQHSVAREWNELLLEAIRGDFARPTVHARNLFHVSAAMYDAWAVYDAEARPYFLGNTVGGYTFGFNGVPVPDDVQAAREEAISYAAYRLLRHRFLFSPSGGLTLQALNDAMASLGYDISMTSTDYTNDGPAALGNYIAQQVRTYGFLDGANEGNLYLNQAYQPVNPPLVIMDPGNPTLVDPNRWQPLTLDVFIDQSGNEIPINTPDFLGPEWGLVTPFALQPEDLTVYERDSFDYYVYHDPGPPPYLDTTMVGGLSEEYKWGFSLVSAWSSHLDPGDSVMWDISPASIGNIQDYPEAWEDYHAFYNFEEGGDASIGHAINPYTGMPYEPQVVPRADYARVLAEFWADGPDSETPPGHWFTILNYVNDHPLFEKRYRGDGPIVDELEWDVKAYFMLGGAMHDVAITAWGIKGWYDYIRPVSAIRYMAELGQSSDPTLPSYHPGGILLVPGFIELVEEGDSLAGLLNEHVGKIKVKAWRGPDYIENPETDYAGVGWILAANWWPYQRPSFVTPPFAGYISGHSTYSRAAAEILTMLTGDPFFPGGMGEFEAPKDSFLVFEQGPSQTFTLQWATYRDASDQTSLSRIWGGIHPPADDIPGRLIGMEIGVDAFDFSEGYFFDDADNDGFYSYEDCDDNDPNVNPGMPETCDGIDNDCNQLIDDAIPVYTYYQDTDGDGFGNLAMPMDTCLTEPLEGFVANADDCNDADAAINPNVAETCDGVDNDCNQLIDDAIPVYSYYRDTDGDGFGDLGGQMDTCLTEPLVGFVANAMDCDDTQASVYPGAPELCDVFDNDCDGMVNDSLPTITYYLDADADGYGDALAFIDTCLTEVPDGYALNPDDCDDADADVNPAAAEIPNNDTDEDCDGIVVDVEDPLVASYRVYPNPASQQLTIAGPVLTNGTLRLIAADGREVLRLDALTLTDRETIGLQQLADGLYWLSLHDTSGAVVHRERVVVLQ